MEQNSEDSSGKSEVQKSTRTFSPS